MMRLSNKGIILFALLATAPGACSRENKAGAALVVAIEGNPTSLDPRVAQDAYSQRIFPLVFEGLLSLDQNALPAPGLALSWEQPDPLTYVFHLAPGRLTPTGHEIAARDVAATFDSLSDPALRSPRKVIRDRIARIEALDDHTVKFTLNQVYAPFLSDLVLGIIPAHADSAEFRARPFGSGPYRVESFEPGAAVTLIANPRFHGAPPPIPRIVFRVVPDDTTRVLALERGEVQLLYNNVPPDDLPLLQKNPRITVRMRPGINYSYLGFNLRDPVLKNRAVREAIAMAIDRETISRCLLKDTVTPAAELMAPSHWAYNPDVEQYPFDPDRAQQLLDQAGFIDPDGDGPEPRFKLEYKTSQSKTRRWVADAIADQLEKVGIAVEVRSYEWGTFFGDVRAGEFQIYSLTWVGITDPDIYYQAFHSASIPPNGDNRNRYQNPAFDSLAEAGRLALTRETRRPIYFQLEQIIAHDLPYVSLWYGNDIVAMDHKLQGFEFYPGGDFRSLARARFKLEN
ncbi:MAG TPA: ABC transporter substrate-binding protein [bacterium]|nr:ABC transporter substrate-binding protein [bacterium]